MRSMVCCHENLNGLPFLPSAAIVAGAALMLGLSLANFVLDKELQRVMVGAARRIKKAVCMRKRSNLSLSGDNKRECPGTRKVVVEEEQTSMSLLLPCFAWQLRLTTQACCQRN